LKSSLVLNIFISLVVYLLVEDNASFLGAL
jgi:hypothetical protein